MEEASRRERVDRRRVLGVCRSRGEVKRVVDLNDMITEVVDSEWKE